MTKITYDKYTQKYFLEFTPSNVIALTLDELVSFKEQIDGVVSDAYAEAMKQWADGFHNDDCGDACKI